MLTIEGVALGFTVETDTKTVHFHVKTAHIGRAAFT